MTDTLIEALRNHKLLEVKPPAEFRLYYDEHGTPLFYSMEALPGRYIIVSKTVYAEGRYNLRVINEQIVHPHESLYRKLVPGTTGTACAPTDVMIVDPLSNTKWNLKTYED
jgi:hypothetical protein